MFPLHASYRRGRDGTGANKMQRMTGWLAD